MTKSILIACLLAIAGTLNAQDIYKWKDDKGQWHFSQTPPASGKSERVDVPTPESLRKKTRAEWQRSFAEFGDEKYKINAPNPHTKALERLANLGLAMCQLWESLGALAAEVGRRDVESESRDQARTCASEAEVAFGDLYQKSQREIAGVKPSAVGKLQLLASTWLSMIRRIPRIETPSLLHRLQQQEKDEILRRQSELDIELM